MKLLKVIGLLAFGVGATILGGLYGVYEIFKN